ncbi:MAG: hypothetical protein L3J68_00015 [Thermoplasmata archaeon]|nr:hypothetical protein [Thermoplasmata archaeon]
MATCPACGIESPVDDSVCPRCHLAVGLFGAVREAAGASSDTDPTYLRTIGELLATVDLPAGSEAPTEPARNLLSRPTSAPELAAGPSTLSGLRNAPAPEPIIELPPEPNPYAPPSEVQHRLREYFQVGRRLGLDFTDFESRAGSAALVDDNDSLEILAREMFVHVSSSIVEEYESLLARRNELAQMLPTASADVELTAVRRAIGVGDLGGAVRRLAHVRDELTKAEQQWQVDRILAAEGDLMVTTIRELGGDPTPAVGPLEEGRRLFAEGHRVESERVLAQAAVALWTLLQPRLLTELRRLRDRMVEERASGLDIEPAVKELRSVSLELRQRNFVGTIISFRRLRSSIDRTAPVGVESAASGELAAELRSHPGIN